MSLFAPITPNLFLRVRRRQNFAEPELKLVFAVLEDALGCLEKYLRTGGLKGKTAYRDTEEWILSRNDDRVFSFTSVCEILGINPDYLRAGLRQWKATFAVDGKRQIAPLDRLRAAAGRFKSTGSRKP